HVLEQEDAIERFCLKLMSTFPRLFRQVDSKKHVLSTSGIDLMSMEALEGQIKDMEKESFYSRDPKSKIARKFIIEQLIARGYKRSEIAKKISVSRKTIYNVLKSDT
ncbi:MAG: HTH domain-containing protein, partial [Desulfobacteraceae bacterium]|nr:HTH domain-containing protein [Desulfobacteraceae bacterium]